MKRFLILVSAFLLGASAFVASAQMQQLPNDPAVKVGKLENGLTYYIRHNDKPAAGRNSTLRPTSERFRRLPTRTVSRTSLSICASTARRISLIRAF